MSSLTYHRPVSFDSDLGPINHVVVTFGSTPMPTGGLQQVVELVDQRRILVLDAEFVAKDDAGTIAVVPASQVGAEAFTGASSGLIDADDIALVADALSPGGVGLVLIYEDLTLLPAIAAWAKEGATVVSEGPVLVDDLIDTVDGDENS